MRFAQKRYVGAEQKQCHMIVIITAVKLTLLRFCSKLGNRNAIVGEIGDQVVWTAVCELRSLLGVH